MRCIMHDIPAGTLGNTAERNTNNVKCVLLEAFRRRGATMLGQRGMDAVLEWHLVAVCCNA